jgi:hypothetical protein
MDDKEVDHILYIAEKIKESTVRNKKEYFSHIYSNFQERFPMLYDMCCSPNFDIAHLEYMLGMIKSMNKGEHDEESASKIVGQTMFDHYVAPALEKSKGGGGEVSLSQ